MRNSIFLALLVFLGWPSITQIFATDNSTSREEKETILNLSGEGSFIDSSSIGVDLELMELCGLLFPNAFTPNGDGLNDVFKPRANEAFGPIDCSWSIYDRTGNLVFVTSNITEGWDGTYNGNPLSVGVYVWLCNGTCGSGPFAAHGNLTLLR